MSKFFINRPIVAMVISIVLVIVGVVSMAESTHLAVPEYCPAGDSGSGNISRRGREDVGAVRCNAY